MAKFDELEKYDILVKPIMDMDIDVDLDQADKYFYDFYCRDYADSVSDLSIYPCVFPFGPVNKKIKNMYNPWYGAVLMFEKIDDNTVKEKVTETIFKRMADIFYSEETGLFFKADDLDTLRSDPYNAVYCLELYDDLIYRISVEEYFKNARVIQTKKTEIEHFALKKGLKVVG